MPAKPLHGYLSEAEKVEVEEIKTQLGLSNDLFSLAMGLGSGSYSQMRSKNKTPRYVLMAAKGLLATNKVADSASNSTAADSKFLLTIVNGVPKISELLQQQEIDHTHHQTLNLNGQDFYLVPFKKEPPTAPVTKVSDPQNGGIIYEGRTRTNTALYPKANPGTKQFVTLEAIRKLLRAEGPTTTRRLVEKLHQRGTDVPLNRVSAYISQEIYSENPTLKRNYATGEVIAI
jgi:hypothetical protein